MASRGSMVATYCAAHAGAGSGCGDARHRRGGHPRGDERIVSPGPLVCPGGRGWRSGCRALGGGRSVPGAWSTSSSSSPRLPLPAIPALRSSFHEPCAMSLPVLPRPGSPPHLLAQPPAPLSPSELERSAVGRAAPRLAVCLGAGPTRGRSGHPARGGGGVLEGTDLEPQELDTLLQSLQTLVDRVEGCAVSHATPGLSSPGLRRAASRRGATHTEPLQGSPTELRPLRRPTDLPRGEQRVADSSPAPRPSLRTFCRRSPVRVSSARFFSGAGIAVVHAPLLKTWCGGVLGVAALGLLADLGRRGLRDVDALERSGTQGTETGAAGSRPGAPGGHPANHPSSTPAACRPWTRRRRGLPWWRALESALSPPRLGG